MMWIAAASPWALGALLLLLIALIGSAVRTKRRRMRASHQAVIDEQLRQRRVATARLALILKDG